MLVELVVAAHRVQLDMVPDGRPVHVEVVAAWLGAVEALERRGHLLNAAGDVGLHDVGEEDGVSKRSVPVCFAQVRDREHGASGGDEVPRVLDRAHLVRVVRDRLLVEDAEAFEVGGPAVRPILRRSVRANDVDGEIGTEQAHRREEEVDAAFDVVLRVRLEPEDPAHHRGLTDEAEHEAVAELS